jgi:hypothetical protein
LPVRLLEVGGGADVVDVVAPARVDAAVCELTGGDHALPVGGDVNDRADVVVETSVVEAGLPRRQSGRSVVRDRELVAELPLRAS